MNATVLMQARRVLVVRPRALGDVLLATPTLRAIKRGVPAAELHVAVDPVLQPVLAHNPHVDRVWTLPQRKNARAGDWLRLYAALRRVRFDAVIDLHCTPRTALLAWATGAPVRVGYALRGRGRLYTLRVPRDTDRHGTRRALYAARTNLEILARCGLPDAVLGDVSLEWPGDPEAEAQMAAWFAAAAPGRPRVGLSPAGTWAAKTYPASHWAQVADALAGAGCTVLLLWAPGEEPVVEDVRRRMQHTAVIPPRTGLAAMAALVGGLDLLVCNDSGIKHAAVARGTATLTLYGPTNPLAWSPPSGPHAGLQCAVPCAACNFTRCAHQVCLRQMPPGVVAARALECLGRPLPPEPACVS